MRLFLLGGAIYEAEGEDDSRQLILDDSWFLPVVQQVLYISNIHRYTKRLVYPTLDIYIHAPLLRRTRFELSEDRHAVWVSSSSCSSSGSSSSSGCGSSCK